ncbi:T4 family baseplate hub assembly chaperone [Vibrio sp. YIC-376]|uniref:T4 family baseplate hub assembly chaperone n=1 Tax=Vibrio sp. YIC-376 TaxID=3136162 RepID=UPI00402A9C43
MSFVLNMRFVLNALSDNKQVEVWELASSCRGQNRAAIMASAYLPDSLKPSFNNWSVAGRDHLLLLAYQCQFGDDINVSTSCTECGEKAELSFTASQILSTASVSFNNGWNAVTRTLDTEVYLPLYHEIHIDGVQCRFRLPCIADLMAVKQGDSVLFQFAQRVLDQESFKQVSRKLAEKEDVHSGWEALFDELERGMLECEPLSVVSLVTACPECGAKAEHQFDIASQFWAQLSAHVEKQLWDVHLLASAYGWSSQDILAMSPARRRRHISMIVE